MPERILTYYQKHRQLVEEYLIGCNDPQNVEAIHQMRLSIKRIRVVGKLADQLTNYSFNAQHSFTALNKFFKSSGRLRDIQVTKQLLVDLQDSHLELVIEKFEKREVKQRAIFEESLEQFDHTTFNDIELRLKGYLAELEPKFVLAGAILLLSQYIYDIRELFHGSNKEKRMHEIRTCLKDINYLNNIFDGQLGIEAYLNISAERLRELGEFAGRWHDHLNLERTLKKFIRKNPESPQRESIHASVEKLRMNKNNLEQEYSCILQNEMKI